MLGLWTFERVVYNPNIATAKLSLIMHCAGII